MLLARTKSGVGRRRGAILLIVLTLVALFSVVGLSFALYAESEALKSRINRESKATSDDPPPVDALASAALGQMLYPAESGAGYGIGNALLKTTRGHDDATMVYGDNPATGVVNAIPYNGVGQFSEIINVPVATGGTVAINRRDIINYSLQFPRLVNGNYVAAANHVVDPSHSGFRNNTQLGFSPGDATNFPTKAYVARNAPYTYPDRLNVKVAMQDPTTGRILVPSYHRPSLFGSLASSNANWRDAASTLGTGDPAGRYKILRPRPWDHRLATETEDQSQFPFPPANPDGTITGDVQNIAQTDGVQRNDSVWVDIGLPPVQWRGRNLQPLVAVTALPLDGRVNVNVAGNRKNSNNQGSTHGFGPWEIGLSKITSDANTMVDTRATLTSFNARGATGATSNRFASGVTQSYAAVNWDAGTTVSPMAQPTGNQSDPAYGASGFDSTTAANMTTEADRHPSLFNPYSWNAFSTGGTLFPHTDLRRASVKYAGKPLDYNQPFFGNPAPTTLTGTGPGNAARQRRALLTTASNSLARPGLMPNFADYTTNNAIDPTKGPLEMNAAGQLGYPAGTFPPALVNPVVVGANGTDFGGALNMRNAMAALAPVNLNRPLADYRDAGSLNAALSPTTVTAAAFLNASNDRQTLARDIFVRLILATGAKAVVNPTAGTIQLPQPGGSAPNYDLIAAGDTTPAQYNALRQLAQLAANIVDAIDNDDVATTFVWNAYAPPPAILPIPATPRSILGADGSYSVMATYFSAGSTNQTDRDTYTTNGIVYGVEKPRVVINEVYAESVNDPADALNVAGNATQPFHVRFWIELLNPGNTQDTASPLGTGTAQLRYAPADGVATAYSVYRMHVYDNAGGGTAIGQVGAQTNPTGNPDLPMPSMPKFTRDFSESDTGNAALRAISPNDGNSPATALNAGFAVYGPQSAASEMGMGYKPNTTATTPPAVVPSPTNSHYPTMGVPDAATAAMPITGHVVLLQRLACPYMPFGNTNPYITVDYLQNVTAQDAVRRASDSVADRTPTGGPSTGRIEPFFGRSTLNVNQTSMDANAASYTPMFRHSLFAHNDGRRSPFDWLAHFDRPLVNQMELQVLAGCRPQELTQFFADASGNANSHAVPLTSTTVPYYRALETLAVKPWGYGLPAEGRVPGKININMIWDQAVLEALLDQNASATNASVNFSATDVANLYYNTTTPANSLIFGTGAFARTKDTTGKIPGSTYDETGLTTDDRPFKPFGTASFAATAGSLLPGGSGLADTLLRDGATAGTPAILTAAGTHPYQRAEMLRKMYNNITTTSDTYLVVMTVGFFEIRNTTFPISTTNPVILGKEVSNISAGDLRGKYVAIVDRSMLGVDASGLQAAGPWQTEVAVSNPPPTPPVGTYVLQFRAHGYGTHPKDSSVPVYQVSYDGKDYFVTTNPIASARVAADQQTTSVLSLGTGTLQQYGTVSSFGYDINGNMTIEPNEIFDPATGIATVVVTGVGSLPPPGAIVSNGNPVNPGPQTTFDVNLPRFQGVVPYFEKVEIGK